LTASSVTKIKMFSPGRSFFTVCGDDLGPGLSSGLSLRRHGPLKLFRQPSIFSAKQMVAVWSNVAAPKLKYQFFNLV
jgi:hypothetical protein